MREMTKFPYVTRRMGSANLYYRRSVAKELKPPGRPAQQWLTSGTADLKAINAPYAKAHAAVEARFAE